MTLPLAERLALERSGPNVFRGFAPDIGGARIFGGAAVGQALLAAYETVEARVCHSLHCYFIHPGNPAEPVFYEVTRSRDGGAFATRHVSAVQDGRPILEMLASFQRPAPGFEHQATLPDAPDPATLGDDDQRGAAVGIQLRNVRLPRPGWTEEVQPPHHQTWLRSALPLGPELRHHQAALAYASDFPQLPTIVQPHPVTWSTPGFQVASLDHAIWFHRPFDFTGWHLCDMDTPSSSDERGLSRATVFAQDGTVVATVLQEAMIRLRAPRG
ncbi:acyl-CoA thioesterase [Sphingomonas immobilis]|uniref:Acyl-CoA thioesterase II n=1 Tax=Sphingomonas immobilis TaxID=3063997 RepID=A0ABT8ZXL7_9SPHN|nr:acyl-CoA thioesterase II [Sphingomonas sp. CA1-15]MDO7842309.1 acyl-CoA thioesterase II [Sphingomonas sp. CA1-15]